MSRQNEIDALEKQIANMSLRVGGSGIKKMLLEQIQFLRNTAKEEPAPSAANQVALEARNYSINIDEFIEKLSIIQDDITHLKNNFNLKEKPSIDYEKIEIVDVRRQLTADNIRMECARLDLSHYHDFHEEQAFRRFCVFAFFQVEQLLTYYFHRRYPSISELKDFFRSCEIKEEYFSSARSIKEVRSFVLISAYVYKFFTSKNNRKSWGLDNIRYIRNMEEHRCAVMLQPENWHKTEREYNKLALPTRRKVAEQSNKPLVLTTNERSMENEYYAIKFIRERDFGAVRDEVRNLYHNVVRQ